MTHFHHSRECEGDVVDLGGRQAVSEQDRRQRLPASKAIRNHDGLDLGHVLDQPFGMRHVGKRSQIPLHESDAEKQPRR